MSAKAYDKKTAAFAGFVIQNIPADLTDDEMDGWMDNPDATKKFLSGLKPPALAVAEQPKPPTLVLHKTVELGQIAGKKTIKCLTSKQWAYKDGDIDRWLRPVQGTQPSCSVGVYQLQNPQGTTFREMAAATLKVGPSTSLDLLAKALTEQGRTFTLPAIEQLVERQEGGEDVGLRTDGYANFFFVENSDGSVSVLCVGRSDDRWRGVVNRLDYGNGWGAERRLLLRNSDPLTL